MPCPRTQENLPVCSPRPRLNVERQARKQWIPFFKLLWYDSTREIKPRSTNCREDALPLHHHARQSNAKNFFTFIISLRRVQLSRKICIPQKKICVILKQKPLRRPFPLLCLLFVSVLHIFEGTNRYCEMIQFVRSLFTESNRTTIGVRSIGPMSPLVPIYYLCSTKQVD